MSHMKRVLPSNFNILFVLLSELPDHFLAMKKENGNDILFLPLFDGKVIYDFYHSRHFGAPRRRKDLQPLATEREHGWPPTPGHNKIL